MVSGGHSHASKPATKTGGHAIEIATRPFGPAPQPSEAIEDAAHRITAAHRDVAARRCDRVAAFNRLGGLKLACTRKKTLVVTGADTFKVTGARAFGSGGVVQYTRNLRKGRTVGVYPMALDSRGRYVPFGVVALPGKPRVGIEPGTVRGYDQAALRFLDSIRSRDCRAFYIGTYTPDLKAKSPSTRTKEACRILLDDTYRYVRAELRSSKTTEMFRLGGTAGFFFYGVRTGDQYRTLIVAYLYPHPLRDQVRVEVVGMFPPRGLRVGA
jgi:hypothetical protein